MDPRIGFALKTLVFSLLLFLVREVLISGPAPLWLAQDAGFVVPAVAVILASGMDTRRKAGTILALGTVFVLGDTVAELSGVRVVSETGIPASDTPGGHVAAGLYHVFRVGVPVAALLVATRGDVTSLWAREAEGPIGTDKCPICGRRRTGLEAHVRDTHGEKALRKLKARGRL